MIDGRMPQPNRVGIIAMVKFVYLVLGVVNLIFWWFTRQIQDLPYYRYTSLWFLVAAAACVGVLAPHRGRFMLPAAASFTTIAYLSRSVSVVVAYNIELLELDKNRVALTAMLWAVLAFFCMITSVGFIRAESEAHYRKGASV